MDSRNNVTTRLRELAPKCSFTIAETAEILGMSPRDLEHLLVHRVLNGANDSAVLQGLRLRAPDVVMLTLVGRPTPDRNPFTH